MYEQELQFAKDLAYKAGELIKKNFVAIGSSDKVWKSDNSPVTETDLAINKMVLDAIVEKFPDHSLLGEEMSTPSIDTEFVWVCDPVDGTIPFSHGWPTSAFTLALCKDGKSVVGVAYDPYMDRMYWATLGEGAFVNGQKIAVSKQDTYSKGYVNINVWPAALYDIYPALSNLKQEGIDMMSLGTAIYAGALVASGQLLANIFPGKTAWDVAALKIIVEEAGGKVTDLFGNEQRYDQDLNGAIISNGGVHDKLVAFFSKHAIKQG